MDTGILNLEEHFSTYYVYDDEEDDPSNSSDNFRSYYNEWEDERELNGDIGLIPESSNFNEPLRDMIELANSPPSMFHKSVDWTPFVCVDDAFRQDSIPPPIADQDVEFKPNSAITNDLNTSLDEAELRSFDLAQYINDCPETNFIDKPKVKSVGKRIDKEAQRYIIEDNDDNLDTSDEIDVETVSECASLPVLEANDAFSLLEQFEASEKPILPNGKCKENLDSSDSFGFSSSLVSNIEMAVNQIPTSPIEIFEKVPDKPIDIFEEDYNDMKDEPKTVKKESIDVDEEKELDVVNVETEQNETKHKVINSHKPQTSDCNTSQSYAKNKHILEALPQELIARINESGKRKTITVIPPIPNKKRSASRSLDNTSQHRNKIPKISSSEQIQLEHDYCLSTTPYPKDPLKDSGFQSEEDDRSVIRNQPMVKNADGKLMVSLLKVNTIRSNNTYMQKKKLNLEEYKKRRFINSNAASQNNSPISSTCSSPLPEDENLKRIKHQEKLMKMAADLLNTPPKSSKQTDNNVSLPKPVMQNPPQEIQPDVVASSRIAPPPDLEVKTYVSIGTNTDISSIKTTKSLFASTKQLEEIKPLLKKVSNKINSNSFITSLIENIPKTKTTINKYVKSENQEVVREDKIIHYLEKDRVPVKTRNTGSQTDFDEVDKEIDSDTESRYRRRLGGSRSSSSSSSGSSSRSARRRRRSSSNSSRHSRSSRSSDSSSSASSRSSRSRSRSISPRRQRQRSAEHVKEVEERRVVFVGRLADGTSREDLRRRFSRFGVITYVSLHFREYGDNYGFVTFANKEDAYEAKEHGNDHAYPKYDLSFGGRRIFCKTSYSDLDNVREDEYRPYSSGSQENSFDALLRAAQEKIRKRKP